MGNKHTEQVKQWRIIVSAKADMLGLKAHYGARGRWQGFIDDKGNRYSRADVTRLYKEKVNG